MSERWGGGHSGPGRRTRGEVVLTTQNKMGLSFLI